MDVRLSTHAASGGRWLIRVCGNGFSINTAIFRHLLIDQDSVFIQKFDIVLL